MTAITARVLPFGRDVQDDLEVMVGPSGEFQVMVPGLGALIVGQVTFPKTEPIVGMAPPMWRAVLVQPDEANEFSPQSRHLKRDVVVDGDDLRVELIPSSSGEDRLVVVIEGGNARAAPEADDD